MTPYSSVCNPVWGENEGEIFFRDNAEGVTGVE